MNDIEFGNKRTVKAVLVKEMRHKVANRNMTLLPFRTRCVRAGDIHELVTTDTPSADASTTVGHVGFIGFVEMTCGGVIEQGDHVWAGDRCLGTVLGFDGCHFPNHYNIILARHDGVATATDIGLEIEDEIVFQPNPEMVGCFVPGTIATDRRSNPSAFVICPSASGDIMTEKKLRG